MRSGNGFVYAVVGDAHVEQLNRSLRFLKHFTRQQIVVLAARHDVPVDHDQVIEAHLPASFDNHQASIVLKTGLHTRLDLHDHTWCYLDSNVFAVHEDVDSIFAQKQNPIIFAADQIRLSAFSRYAVRCACNDARNDACNDACNDTCNDACDHLREAIAAKFGVDVSVPDWQHWNGGVFVFDAHSIDFLNTWHAFTLDILNDPQWRTRDQGTLAAAAWKCGLENQPLLPARFNYIVDGQRNLPYEQRADNPLTYTADDSYSLEAGSPTHPAFLHFIGNTSKPGWRNWDQAEAKLAASKLPAAEVALP